MPKFLHSKAVLIGGGAVILLVAVYFLFLRSDAKEPSSGLTEVASSAADALIGRDLLALLAQLKATKIEKSFFDNRTFQSLEDFSREIAEQPIGRDNPFAPVGVESEETKKVTAPATTTKATGGAPKR